MMERWWNKAEFQTLSPSKPNLKTHQHLEKLSPLEMA